jgi:hypothetical protein
MTHTKDEALKLALEELENCADLLKVFEAPIDSCVGATMLQAEAAITAIKQALSDATHLDETSSLAALVQEPVVFYRCNGCGHAYEQVHPTSCDCMEAGGFDRVEYYTTPPEQPAPVPLTARELELIDGMIQVQLRHAEQCDGIANRTMAEKQKGWDMERVALLQKLKEKNSD